jgi:syntaxin-binding protein 1
MKTKYSVHSSLSKKCFDDYGELKLERIISAEQAMATGQTEDGERVGVPPELSGLIRGNEIRVSDKLRLLMLLYASDPSCINQRPQFELNSGLSTIDQACTQEWCRIVEMAGRRNQRRAPAHETEWQFLTSRYIPAIHDIIKGICTDKLNSKDFSFEDTCEEKIPFAAGGGSYQSKRSSVRPGFGTNVATQAKQPALYVFIAGGISYNEIRLVHILSQELGRDIIIGSTHIYSPLDLCDQLSSLNQSSESPCYKSCFIGDQDYFST